MEISEFTLTIIELIGVTLLIVGASVIVASLVGGSLGIGCGLIVGGAGFIGATENHYRQRRRAGKR